MQGLHDQTALIFTYTSSISTTINQVYFNMTAEQAKQRFFDNTGRNEIEPEEVPFTDALTFPYFPHIS